LTYIIIIIQELFPIQNNLLEEDEVNFENNLIMLNQRDIEAEIEAENRLFDEQVRIGPNWEKVLVFMDNLSTKMLGN